MCQANPFVRGLKCRVCGKHYPAEPINFCTDDFGPLEVDYDYEAIAESLSREKIESRPRRVRLGHYMFFADLEGAADDERVSEALEALGGRVQTLKVLGSYPVSGSKAPEHRRAASEAWQQASDWIENLRAQVRETP